MNFKKKCVVEYDGTDFYGWQRQKNLRTVQQVIEDALSKIYKTEIKIVGSGRTDSGVHALGQVFHYSSSKYLVNRSVLMGLNSILPYDVAIKDVNDVNDNFHAQKSAKSKTYLYKIYNQPIRSAIFRKRAWWIREKLDVYKLEKLLEIFVGEKDFSSMCQKRSLPENPVRKINFINVIKEDAFINIEINANGFLHNMVRNIVGTVIDIYFKGGDIYDVIHILNSGDRTLAGRTAPACGLYLKEVFY